MSGFWVIQQGLEGVGTTLAWRSSVLAAVGFGSRGGAFVDHGDELLTHGLGHVGVDLDATVVSQVVRQGVRGSVVAGGDAALLVGDSVADRLRVFLDLRRCGTGQGLGEEFGFVVGTIALGNRCG